MFFEAHITVPASTTQATPQETRIKLTKGVIHEIELAPWGAAVDILHCSIRRAVHQIFPTNPDAPVSFSGQKIEGRVYHPIDEDPLEVQVYSWNDSTLYAHSFTIRLWLLPREMVEPAAGVFKRFTQWFEGIIKPRG